MFSDFDCYRIFQLHSLRILYFILSTPIDCFARNQYFERVAAEDSVNVILEIDSQGIIWTILRLPRLLSFQN
jgi:hypothetical protein